MISSLFSFVFRSIILNPMALLGIVIGGYTMYSYDLYTIKYLAMSPYVYGVLFLISLIYACLFAHVYVPNSTKIDWKATIMSSVNHLITILFMIVFVYAAVFAYNYAFADKIDAYLRYKNH